MARPPVRARSRMGMTTYIVGTCSCPPVSLPLYLRTPVHLVQHHQHGSTGHTRFLVHQLQLPFPPIPSRYLHPPQGATLSSESRPAHSQDCTTRIIPQNITAVRLLRLYSRCVINLVVPPMQTTTLPSGKLCINRRLRSSYSTLGTCGVSSPSLILRGWVERRGWPCRGGLEMWVEGYEVV
jgi:hypothetical protein